MDRPLVTFLAFDISVGRFIKEGADLKFLRIGEGLIGEGVLIEGALDRSFVLCCKVKAYKYFC